MLAFENFTISNNRNNNQIPDTDVEFVRSEQYASLTEQHANGSIGFKPYMIKKIIDKHIHEGMTGFGSRRVYSSFGLDTGVLKKIHRAVYLKKCELAVNIIQIWFTDMMFRPGGSGLETAKMSFERNGKILENRH